MSKRSYGAFLAEVFDNPMVERFQRRRLRRALVVAMLVFVVLELAVCVFAPTAWWLWGPLLLVFFPLASMINMATRGVTEIPIQHLDDRLAELRLRAFHDACYLAIAVALLAGMWILSVFNGIETSETDPQTYVLAAIGAVTFGVLAGLPALLLAWRLPSESADEEGD